MKIKMSLLGLSCVMILSGCQLSLDPEVLAERNRVAAENGLRHQRGDYSNHAIEPYEFEFKFSKAVSKKEVNEQIYHQLKNGESALSYRERRKRSKVNVPGSDLQLLQTTGLKTYSLDKFPAQHPDQAFMNAIGGKKYIFEYRDGEQWAQADYRDLDSVRMWHVEVVIEDDLSNNKNYNQYVVTLLPVIHYTSAKYDAAIDRALTEEQVIANVKARIDSLKRMSITKSYTLEGEQKLKNDDITAFANVRRILKSSFNQPPEDKQADTERYGQVRMDDSVIDFSIYPYKKNAIVQYHLQYPFSYTVSPTTAPNEYSEKQAMAVVKKFARVLNN